MGGGRVEEKRQLKTKCSLFICEKGDAKGGVDLWTVAQFYFDHDYTVIL